MLTFVPLQCTTVQSPIKFSLHAYATPHNTRFEREYLDRFSSQWVSEYLQFCAFLLPFCSNVPAEVTLHSCTTYAVWGGIRHK
jgi:hypothetical protein